jgi:hypothetical protein
VHTEEEIQRAAKLAEEIGPSSVSTDDTTDLRTLAEAVNAVRASERRVRELVAQGTRQRPVLGRNRDRARRLESGGTRALRRQDLRPGSRRARGLPRASSSTYSQSSERDESGSRRSVYVRDRP